MQLDELVVNVLEEAILIIKDYSHAPDKSPQELLNTMLRAFEEDISDSVYIARILSLGTTSSHLEQLVSPRGYRMLNRIPRIPLTIIDNLVERFEMLKYILPATIEELDDVEGIGEVRARSIKSGLQRMQEQTLPRYIV